MGTIGRLAEKCNTIVVPADATSVGDLENLIDKTMEHFGGKFDFKMCIRDSCTTAARRSTLRR